MSNYKPKTVPFKHQSKIFDERKDTPAWGVLWEQGTGKTKVAVDKAGHLFFKGEIDAILVVAPNGVHRNWMTDEIPTHMPDEIRKQAKIFMYRSGKAGTKTHQKGLKDLLSHKGLIVLTISYNGFMTKQGKAFVWKFLRQRRCFYILDESHNIKSPGAKRTRSIVASSKYAPFKTILTGTPVAQGPFDIYSQIKFLDEFFWHDKGIGSFSAFKQYFGIWITADDFRKEWGYDPGYDQLLGYKNLDKLEEWLKTISDRLTKEDANLNLPPKLYSKRYFDLLPVQEKAYDDLKNEFITELSDGTFVEAPLAIVRLLRFQQITSGYIGTEVGEPVRLLSEKNPRMDLLMEILEELPHKAIIWARYVEDINQIMKALGDQAVRYDGSVSPEERAEAIARFQGRRPIMENGNRTGWEDIPPEKQAKFFVGNPQAGATGITLHAAKTVIYYSNSFNLVDRLQSEDRAHRIGQEHPVNYIDIVANGTVDEHIVKSLRNKFDVATQITGDTLKEWL